MVLVRLLWLKTTYDFWQELRHPPRASLWIREVRTSLLCVASGPWAFFGSVSPTLHGRFPSSVAFPPVCGHCLSGKQQLRRSIVFGQTVDVHRQTYANSLISSVHVLPRALWDRTRSRVCKKSFSRNNFSSSLLYVRLNRFWNSWKDSVFFPSAVPRLSARKKSFIFGHKSGSWLVSWEPRKRRKK